MYVHTNMNIVFLITVVEVVYGLTREQYWTKRDADDICYLGNTGSSNTSSLTLVASLASAMMRNVTVVSYDEASGTTTFHDGSTIHTAQQEVYTHATMNSYNDCSDVNPIYCSDVFRVTPTSGITFDVYCEMGTPYEPWTVIHNRQNGDVDFYRNWVEYKAGFGDPLGNFWLGLDKIHVLTSFPSKLRIELEAWNGTKGYVDYSGFQIASEADNYRLNVQGYSGNISDALTIINGQPFSTWDNDNDVTGSLNCAMSRQGAWWYKECSMANLNGPYVMDTGDIKASMAWKYFFPERNHVPMKKSRMMIKRL